MASNEFSLQPALDYKQRLEEICQMDLAKIETIYRQEDEALRRLADQEEQSYNALSSQHGQASLDLGAITTGFAGLRSLQHRIERQTKVLQELAQEMEKKREELVEISKEKKALEKLKEKHEREVARTIAVAEDKAMQEIATAQFHRRRVSRVEA